MIPIVIEATAIIAIVGMNSAIVFKPLSPNPLALTFVTVFPLSTLIWSNTVAAIPNITAATTNAMAIVLKPITLKPFLVFILELTAKI